MNKPSLSISETVADDGVAGPLAHRPASLLTISGSGLGLAIFMAALAPLQAGPGSLWREDSSRSMVADRRAQKVGDILTILVQENSTASKDNSTKTSKSSSVDAAVNTFFYSPTASTLLTKEGTLPAMRFQGRQDFTGGGKINNSEQITARIAVRVIDVLPNATLLIEGRKHTSFSGEKQEVVLRGSVRSEDVTANNTVFSYNVADASIQFFSKGTVSDNQRKGWLMKIWEKLTPF